MSENKHTPSHVALVHAEWLEKSLTIGAPEAAAELRRLHEVEKQCDKLLAEFCAYKEGSEEAFGTVITQKQAAEARLKTMQSTISSQQGVICDFREQIATLTRQRDLAVEALEKSREALQFANDSPGGGINDTIWMMHSPETLFDFMDAALSTIKGSEAMAQGEKK